MSENIKYVVFFVPSLSVPAVNSYLKLVIFSTLLNLDHEYIWSSSIFNDKDITHKVKSHYFTNASNRFYLPLGWHHFPLRVSDQGLLKEKGCKKNIKC